MSTRTMRLCPTLGIALAALLAGGARTLPAQVFAKTYGSPAEISRLTSVIPTAGGKFAATAFRSNGGDKAFLLHLQADGVVAGVNDYGAAFTPLQPLQVRELPGGGFVWVGSDFDGALTVPVVTVTDANGFGPVSKSFRLTLPNGLASTYALARQLEINSADDSLIVGGDLWRQDIGRSELWLAKLDAALNPAWIKILSFPQPVLLKSIQPARDGGIVGVGRITITDGQGLSHGQLLSVKLDAMGNLVWSYRYRAQNTGLFYDQELTDVDRDPLSTDARSVVTGSVSSFCPNPPLGNCDGMIASAALLGTLNETTGVLSQLFGLSVPGASTTATRGTSVVEDFPRREAVVLAATGGADVASREALLIRALSATGGVVASRRFGDGPDGAFGVDPRSLESVQGGEPGFVFLLDQADSGGTTRENLVRTDSMLHSTEHCEAPQPVAPAAAPVETVRLFPALRPGLLLNIQFMADDFPLGAVACDAP